MVVVNEWHVGGTGGSGIVFIAADVLWMCVVREMRGGRRRNNFIMTHDSYKILQHKNKQN